MWCLVIQIPFLIISEISPRATSSSKRQCIALCAVPTLEAWFKGGDEPGGRCLCGPGWPQEELQVACVWKGAGAVSLTFVFSHAPHRFQSRCLHGLLVADEPVEPPSSQLPELRVAGHEPPRAQRRLLQRGRAHQRPRRGAGVLRHPGVCRPDPTRRLWHGLASGAAAGALLENQAGPLQQQEAAGHQVRCGEEEEQKLRPTEKLLQPEESSGHALAEAGPLTPPDRPLNPRLAERWFLP